MTPNAEKNARTMLAMRDWLRERVQRDLDTEDHTGLAYCAWDYIGRKPDALPELMHRFLIAVSTLDAIASDEPARLGVQADNEALLLRVLAVVGLSEVFPERFQNGNEG